MTQKNSPRKTWGYRHPVRPGKWRQEAVSVCEPEERRNSTFGSFSSVSSSPLCWSPSPSPSDTWYDWWRLSAGGRDWLVWRTVLAGQVITSDLEFKQNTTGGSGVVEVEGDIIKYKMVLGERYRNFNGKISMIRIFNLLASSLSVSSQLFKSCYKFYSPRKNARMMTDWMACRPSRHFKELKNVILLSQMTVALLWWSYAI